MRSTEKFFREVHAEDLTRAFDGTKDDVITILADHDEQRVWAHDRKGGRIDMGKALDTVGASRKVRAWRRKR